MRKFAFCIGMVGCASGLLWANTQETLKPLPRYDWTLILQTPPSRTTPVPGNQILHFKSSNKSYELSEDSKKFVETYLKDAQQVDSDAGVLRFASDHVTLKGAYLELGVCTGKTINFIAALNPQQKIYGFDSFEGLPTPWDRDDITFKAGTFGRKNKNFVPPVLHNVELYGGVFQDTLPKFKEQILRGTPIAFLHVDCDTYSSTKDTFRVLGENIVPGTIIVFDELYNYPGFERHEWKALQEFLKDKRLSVEFLAFNPLHEQVALRVVQSAD